MFIEQVVRQAVRNALSVHGPEFEPQDEWVAQVVIESLSSAEFPNTFSNRQKQALEELAGCYWDTNLRNVSGMGFPGEVLATMRNRYIEDMIQYLSDPTYKED